MTEYLIEVQQDGKATHVVNVNIKNRKETTLSVATTSGYQYCTKFKNKSTAEGYAKKIENAVVVPSFGGYVNSQKSAVGAKQGNVNSRTHFADTMGAYRKNKY
jgi:hypothetical protein